MIERSAFPADRGFDRQGTLRNLGGDRVAFRHAVFGECQCECGLG